MKLVHTKKNVVHPAEVSAANLKPPHCIAETQSLQKIARQFPVNQVQVDGMATLSHKNFDLVARSHCQGALSHTSVWTSKVG